jgi:PAS domain S-box-containing protein
MFRVFLCVAKDHQPWLVVVAALVCVVATAATFFLYARTPAFPVWRRWGWLAMTGLVSGAGIWTTHFVAMLAFRTGLPTGYDAIDTLGSLGVAAVSTSIGFSVASSGASHTKPRLMAVAGGLIVGLGITFMHYVGMSGYRTEGVIRWDTAYVAASVAVGAVFSAGALLAARPGVNVGRQALGAALLTLGIVGMHFTGMTAVTIVPDASVRVPPEVMSDASMAIAAVAVTALIIITAIGGVAIETAARSGNLRRLREALDVMPEGLAFYDAADRLVAWNTRYGDLCAAAGAPLVAGMPFHELISVELAHGAYPDAVGREAEWLAERQAMHIAKSGSLTQRIAGGRWLRITERRTADGGTVSVSVDITELKRAEAAMALSEERFRRMAVNAPDMISEARLDGVLTYVSPASLAITGFTPDELVGRTFASVMHPDDAAKVLAMCQAVFESKGAVEPWLVEFRATHKSGAPLWLECKPTLAVDPATGRFTGLTDVVRDITPRKALEAQLRQAQADAEAATAVKAEFLANMSHELRTPLTSIIGFTGLAAEQNELSDLSRDYVGRVGNASRALLCTVNDILDFSKLEAGQVVLHPQPVALGKLLRGALDLFTPQAGAKDLALVLDDDGEDDLVLALDPDRIRQILLNFLSNAVKFTETGSVTLRTRYDRDARVLALDVIDTGAGIAPDKQDLLFKRFSQIDGSLTRAHTGTGLGLAICKGLVETMGGEIGVESHAGAGSRFWFRIPTAQADFVTEANPGASAERMSFVGARVLVVDDHPTNRELARLFLAGVGVEVTEAADGEEAVQLAMQWPFDAILMDIRMPRLDGHGALARIRAESGPNDATPILAFTADADAKLVQRLREAGFQDVVAKPVDPASLIAAVARATAFLPDAQTVELDHVA